jgi:very-short-patch-repair endonuclease
LVIEIDGDSHDGKEEADFICQKKLESKGLTVLRFWDLNVPLERGLLDFFLVLAEIYKK